MIDRHQSVSLPASPPVIAPVMSAVVMSDFVMRGPLINDALMPAPPMVGMQVHAPSIAVAMLWYRKYWLPAPMSGLREHDESR